MYSASLFAAIIQRLLGNLAYVEELPSSLRLPQDLTRLGVDGLGTNQYLPVLAHSTSSTLALRAAFPGLRFDDSSGGLFGRGFASLGELVAFATQSAERPADSEYFDLGTPVRANANQQWATCQRILPKTADADSARALAVVVDSGVSAKGLTPNTFGGKVTHLIATDIDFSAHATGVLSTLLAEVERLGLDSQVHVVCALVAPAPGLVGQLGTGRVLDLDNVVNLSDSLAEVRKHLSRTALPAVVNLSLGTHVGPHLGTTPLEVFTSSLVMPASRYVVVAAGNDGERGCHASCHMQDGDQDTLQLLVGPTGAKELMVEFWWEDRGQQHMKLEIEVSDVNGKSLFTGPMTVDTSTGLTPRPVRTPSKSQQVLVESPASLNGLRCVAYALEATNAADLANARIRVDIDPAAEVSIHAWIILCDDERTAWVPSESHGTVTVPSTATDVIGVGGVDGVGRNWTQSSRGLSNCLAQSVLGARCWIHGAFHSPAVAAQVASIPPGAEGTSFSAPRVSARVLEALLDASPPTSLDSLLSSLTGNPVRTGGAFSTWSPRRGYGVV